MRSFQSFSLAIVICVLLVCGCSPSVTILEIGEEKLSLEEYERLYERNVGNREAAQQSSLEEREKFLNLLTNYKLKLRDAYDRNLLMEKDVQDELSDYRTSVATTFMVEREVTEPGLRAMYERRKEELRARHILLRADPNASGEDTMKVWNRAMDLIRQLDEGKDFAELAEANSEDPSASQNKGDLYYFTTGQMVPPFEDAAYSLRINEYTERPVRTQFGYHIIKLTDRKPTVYSISVGHIMISTRGADSAAQETALEKIRALQDSLKAGQDFATLARNHSEDPGSAPRGGSLGSFSRRRFVQDFEEVAFTLKPGEISDIVKTQFGYHLIKCDDIRPLPPYPELRTELQRTYQSYRYNDDYNAYMGRLKNRTGYAHNDKVLQEFWTQVDTTKLPRDSAWAANVSEDVRRKTAITVGSRTVTIDALISALSTRDDLKNTPITSSNFSSQIGKVGERVVLEVASIGLEDRYPEFKSLMKEFQDGVVLYKAEQLEVWNKIEVTEERLRAFYEERKDQHPLPNRVEFVEVSTDSQRLARRFANDLKKGRILDTLVARSKGKLQKTSRGLIAADTDTLTKLAWNGAAGSIIGPLQHNKRHVVMRVVKKDPARNKTFEEASAEISTAFQDYEAKRLEHEWLERLREKYPVVQHKDHLVQAFNTSSGHTTASGE
jgi:peptidyl-prolyl cis-trans isomerase SurA